MKTIALSLSLALALTLALSLSRLDHYSQMSDVQTLAMLCSVFRAQGPPDAPCSQQPARSALPPHHSRYVSPASAGLLAAQFLIGQVICLICHVLIGQFSLLLIRFLLVRLLLVSLVCYWSGFYWPVCHWSGSYWSGSV